MPNANFNNTVVLKHFVSENDLQDNNSNINFNCEYEIKTPNATETVFCEARITFNGFDNEGELSIYTDLPPSKFPSEFKAKWNEFSIEDGVLVVKDKHPIIGKYEARITPLGRV